MGGKGGDMMAKSKDLQFYIKEISGSDQATLLKIAPSYARHIVGDSFICRFFFHFKKGRRSYVVMNNWMPVVNSVVDADRIKHIFDLKGAADDKMMMRDYRKMKAVHARCFHCCTFCGCKTSVLRT